MIQSEDEEDDHAISFAAEEIKTTLEYRLHEVGKSLENIDYLGGADCTVNKKLSGLLGVPFIGCASNRLNLAIQTYLAQSPNASLISKVNNLMKALMSFKNSLLLQKETFLKPEILDMAAHWFSIFSMLDKYLNLHCDIKNCDFDQDVRVHIPDAAEHQSITTLHRHLREMDEVYLELQKDDTDLPTVRIMFDGKLL